LIVVSCSVGSLANLTCIVDTGATETVVDTSIAKSLSLAARPDRATFLTQEVAVSAVSIPSLQLGPLRIENLPGLATDLSTLTPQLGIRPDILVGMDVLDRTNFLIDYQARQLTFAPAQQPLAHTASLIHKQRFALVESFVTGRRVLLQVDTGFPGLLLYEASAGNFAGPGGLEGRVESLSHTFVASHRGRQEVRIGDWRSSHLDLSVIEADQNSLVFDGLLGPQALHARRIAFDFENNLVSWE